MVNVDIYNHLNEENADLENSICLDSARKLISQKGSTSNVNMRLKDKLNSKRGSNYNSFVMREDFNNPSGSTQFLKNPMLNT